MPKGFKTEDGDRPEYAGIYQMKDDCEDYKIRTKLNVEHSDGTVIFSTKVNSPGTLLTKKWCTIIGRPFIVNPTSGNLVYFIRKYRIGTLNVAGNRESKSPGIEQRTYETVLEALKKQGKE